MLCLRDLHVSPIDSVYCGWCGGSFGGRRCEQGHLTPSPAARCCTACGSGKLSSCTPALRLRPTVRVAAWAALLVALKLLYAERVDAARASWHAAWWLAGEEFGLSPCPILHFVVQLVTWFSVAFAATFLLPASHGSKMRQLLWTLLRSSVRFAWSAAAFAARFATRIVEGNHSHEHRPNAFEGNGKEKR